MPQEDPKAFARALKRALPDLATLSDDEAVETVTDIMQNSSDAGRRAFLADVRKAVPRFTDDTQAEREIRTALNLTPPPRMDDTKQRDEEATQLTYNRLISGETFPGVNAKAEVGKPFMQPLPAHGPSMPPTPAAKPMLQQQPLRTEPTKPLPSNEQRTQKEMDAGIRKSVDVRVKAEQDRIMQGILARVQQAKQAPLAPGGATVPAIGSDGNAAAQRLALTAAPKAGVVSDATRQPIVSLSTNPDTGITFDSMMNDQASLDVAHPERLKDFNENIYDGDAPTNVPLGPAALANAQRIQDEISGLDQRIASRPVVIDKAKIAELQKADQQSMAELYRTDPAEYKMEMAPNELIGEGGPFYKRQQFYDKVLAGEYDNLPRESFTQQALTHLGGRLAENLGFLASGIPLSFGVSFQGTPQEQIAAAVQNKTLPEDMFLGKPQERTPAQEFGVGAADLIGIIPGLSKMGAGLFGKTAGAAPQMSSKLLGSYESPEVAARIGRALKGVPKIVARDIATLGGYETTMHGTPVQGAESGAAFGTASGLAHVIAAALPKNIAPAANLLIAPLLSGTTFAGGTAALNAAEGKDWREGLVSEFGKGAALGMFGALLPYVNRIGKVLPDGADRVKFKSNVRESFVNEVETEYTPSSLYDIYMRVSSERATDAEVALVTNINAATGKDVGTALRRGVTVQGQQYKEWTPGWLRGMLGELGDKNVTINANQNKEAQARDQVAPQFPATDPVQRQYQNILNMIGSTDAVQKQGTAEVGAYPGRGEGAGRTGQGEGVGSSDRLLQAPGETGETPEGITTPQQVQSGSEGQQGAGQVAAPSGKLPPNSFVLLTKNLRNEDTPAIVLPFDGDISKAGELRDRAYRAAKDQDENASYALSTSIITDENGNPSHVVSENGRTASFGSPEANYMAGDVKAYEKDRVRRMQEAKTPEEKIIPVNEQIAEEQKRLQSAREWIERLNTQAASDLAAMDAGEPVEAVDGRFDTWREYNEMMRNHMNAALHEEQTRIDKITRLEQGKAEISGELPAVAQPPAPATPAKLPETPAAPSASSPPVSGNAIADREAGIGATGEATAGRERNAPDYSHMDFRRADAVPRSREKGEKGVGEVYGPDFRGPLTKDAGEDSGYIGVLTKLPSGKYIVRAENGTALPYEYSGQDFVGMGSLNTSASNSARMFIFRDPKYLQSQIEATGDEHAATPWDELTALRDARAIYGGYDKQYKAAQKEIDLRKLLRDKSARAGNSAPSPQIPVADSGSSTPNLEAPPSHLHMIEEGIFAGQEVDPLPSEARKGAGNYVKPEANWNGLTLTGETPKGLYRAGLDAAGKPWSQKMNHDYGYINGYMGKDKDHVDMVMGPNPGSDFVYIVDQRVPMGIALDEHKVMLGFNNEAEAKAAYLSNYDKTWKNKQGGEVHGVPTNVDELKSWLKSADKKKPARDVYDDARKKRKELIGKEKKEAAFLNSPAYKANLEKVKQSNERYRRMVADIAAGRPVSDEDRTYFNTNKPGFVERLEKELLPTSKPSNVITYKGKDYTATPSGKNFKLESVEKKPDGKPIDIRLVGKDVMDAARQAQPEAETGDDFYRRMLEEAKRKAASQKPKAKTPEEMSLTEWQYYVMSNGTGKLRDEFISPKTRDIQVKYDTANKKQIPQQVKQYGKELTESNREDFKRAMDAYPGKEAAAPAPRENYQLTYPEYLAKQKEEYGTDWNDAYEKEAPKEYHALIQMARDNVLDVPEKAIASLPKIESAKPSGMLKPKKAEPERDIVALAKSDGVSARDESITPEETRALKNAVKRGELELVEDPTFPNSKKYMVPFDERLKRSQELAGASERVRQMNDAEDKRRLDAAYYDILDTKDKAAKAQTLSPEDAGTLLARLRAAPGSNPAAEKALAERAGKSATPAARTVLTRLPVPDFAPNVTVLPEAVRERSYNAGEALLDNLPKDKTEWGTQQSEIDWLPDQKIAAKLASIITDSGVEPETDGSGPMTFRGIMGSMQTIIRSIKGLTGRKLLGFESLPDVQRSIREMLGKYTAELAASQVESREDYKFITTYEREKNRPILNAQYGRLILQKVEYDAKTAIEEGEGIVRETGKTWGKYKEYLRTILGDDPLIGNLETSYAAMVAKIDEMREKSNAVADDAAKRLAEMEANPPDDLKAVRALFSAGLPKQLPNSKYLYDRDIVSKAFKSGVVPVLPIEKTVKAKPGDAAYALKEAVSTGDMRPTMGLIYSSPERKEQVATDGHIAVVLDAPQVKKFKYMDVSGKEVKALAGKQGEEPDVLTESHYPNYAAIIPNDPYAAHRLKDVDLAALAARARGVERANKFIDDPTGIDAVVNFGEGENGLTVYFDPALIVRAAESLLRAGVKTVTVEGASATRALVLRDKANKKNLAIVMPRRRNEGGGMIQTPVLGVTDGVLVPPMSEQVPGESIKTSSPKRKSKDATPPESTIDAKIKKALEDEGTLESRKDDYGARIDGDRIKVTLPIKLWDANVLQKISDGMRKKGYEWRGAEDARAIISRSFSDDGIVDASRNEDFAAVLTNVFKLNAVEKTKTDVEKAHTSLARKFGYTNNPREAGWIMPNGNMLDFSGKKFGGPGNDRALDHREALSINDDYDRDYETLDDLKNTGAIRAMPESGGVELNVAPTRQQRFTIGKFFEFGADRGNPPIVELKHNGETYYKQYPEGTRPARVLGDIDRFFRGELHQSDRDRAMLFSKRAPLDTPEFKRFIDGSKVVDADGNPIPVFHSTDKKFTKFSFKNSPQKIIWITSDRGAAERGEVGAAGRGVTMELYASIKNPAGWEEYEKYGLGELYQRGYDGAILPDPDGTFTAFVFDSGQLKSVENRGEWDRSNGNILHSTRDASDLNNRPFSQETQDRLLVNTPPEFRENLHEIAANSQRYGFYNIAWDMAGYTTERMGDSFHELGHRYALRFAPAWWHEAMLAAAENMDSVVGKKTADAIRRKYDTQQHGVELEAEFFRQMAGNVDRAQQKARAWGERIASVLPEEKRPGFVKRFVEWAMGFFRMAWNTMKVLRGKNAKMKAEVYNFFAGKSGQERHEVARTPGNPLESLTPELRNTYIQKGFALLKRNVDTPAQFALEFLHKYGPRGARYAEAVYDAVTADYKGGQGELFSEAGMEKVYADRYPVAGGTVDGREVIDNVPNITSISATFDDWTELPGIREVPMSDFTDKVTAYSTRDFERSKLLAEQLKEGKQIKPLIVAVDDEGPYILEGSHRFDALVMIGAKSFPAVVAIDAEASKLPDWMQEGQPLFSRRGGQIVLSHERGLFVFNGDFADKDIAKDAGFKWNPASKTWYTDSPTKALRLVRYADGSAKAALGEKYKDIEKKQEKNAAKASEGDAARIVETKRAEADRWFEYISNKLGEGYWYQKGEDRIRELFPRGSNESVDKQLTSLKDRYRAIDDKAAAEKAARIADLKEVQAKSIYLDVPYEEKDYARRYGAKWDSIKRQWYFPGSDIPKELKKFAGDLADRVPESETIHLSRGSGYGGKPYETGTTIRNSAKAIERGEPEFLHIIRAKKEYVREDGLSFGVGEDEGYIYSATARAATEEEAAQVRERIRVREEKARGVKALETIARQIQEEGTRPDGRNAPEGEQIEMPGKPQNLYGGGEWFVVGKDKIWHVSNNGSDGSDWGQNNVATGGAGAIGSYVPYDKALDNVIRSANESAINGTAPIQPEVKTEPDDERQYMLVSKRDQTETEEFKKWFGNSKIVRSDGTPRPVFIGGRAGKTEFTRTQRNEFPFGVAFANTNEGVGKTYAGMTPEEQSGETQYHVHDEQPGEAYKVYLSIKNPWDLDKPFDENEWWNALHKDDESQDQFIQRIGGEIDHIDEDPVTGKRTTYYNVGSSRAFLWKEIYHDFESAVKELWNAQYLDSDISLRDAVDGTLNGKAAIMFPDAAKQIAAEHEYDGVIFKDSEMGGKTIVPFESTQIKSATGNNGNFSRTDPNILHSKKDPEQEEYRNIAKRVNKEVGAKIVGESTTTPSVYSETKSGIRIRVSNHATYEERSNSDHELFYDQKRERYVVDGRKTYKDLDAAISALVANVKDAEAVPPTSREKRQPINPPIPDPYRERMLAQTRYEWEHPDELESKKDPVSAAADGEAATAGEMRDAAGKAPVSIPESKERYKAAVQVAYAVRKALEMAFAPKTVSDGLILGKDQARQYHQIIGNYNFTAVRAITDMQGQEVRSILEIAQEAADNPNADVAAKGNATMAWWEKRGRHMRPSKALAYLQKAHEEALASAGFVASWVKMDEKGELSFGGKQRWGIIDRKTLKSMDDMGIQVWDGLVLDDGRVVGELLEDGSRQLYREMDEAEARQHYEDFADQFPEAVPYLHKYIEANTAIERVSILGREVPVIPFNRQGMDAYFQELYPPTLDEEGNPVEGTGWQGIENYVHSMATEGKKSFATMTALLRKRKADIMKYNRGILSAENRRDYNLSRVTTAARMNYLTSEIKTEQAGVLLALTAQPLKPGEKPLPGYIPLSLDRVDWRTVRGMLLRSKGFWQSKGVNINEVIAGTYQLQRNWQIPAKLEPELVGRFEDAAMDADPDLAAARDAIGKAFNGVVNSINTTHLIRPGTAATNYISGELQLMQKTIQDVVYAALTVSPDGWIEARNSLTVAFRRLSPKARREFEAIIPREAFDRNFYADLGNTKSEEGVTNKLLIPFQAIEVLFKARVWDLTLKADAERRAVEKTASWTPERRQQYGKNMVKQFYENPLPETLERARKSSDDTTYDYSNIPRWLSNLKKSPWFRSVLPYPTYLYKFGSQFLKGVWGITGVIPEGMRGQEGTIRDALGLGKLGKGEFKIDSRVLSRMEKMGYNPKHLRMIAQFLATGAMIAGPALLMTADKKRLGAVGPRTDAEGRPYTESPADRKFDVSNRILAYETDDALYYLRALKYPWIREALAVNQMGNEDWDIGNYFGDLVSLGSPFTLGMNMGGYTDKYNEGKPLGAMIGERVGSDIPFAPYLNDLATFVDPKLRQGYDREKGFNMNMLTGIASKLPGFSMLLPEKYDSQTGQTRDIPREMTAWNFITGLRFKEVVKDEQAVRDIVGIIQADRPALKNPEREAWYQLFNDREKQIVKDNWPALRSKLVKAGMELQKIRYNTAIERIRAERKKGASDAQIAAYRDEIKQTANLAANSAKFATYMAVVGEFIQSHGGNK